MVIAIFMMSFGNYTFQTPYVKGKGLILYYTHEHSRALTLSIGHFMAVAASSRQITALLLAVEPPRAVHFT